MNIKNVFKHFFGRFPAIFFPLYQRLAPQHHKRECLLNDKSELVIEGFPRSANTFAVVAFRQAQKVDVPMAHHLHVEAQILRGVALGIPVVALIRKPEDAVKSLLIRHPDVKPKHAIERYIEFYSAVEKVADKVIVADFDQVTSNFGGIISRINKKFRTDYKVFESSAENISSVCEEIDQINRELHSGKETHVARPSSVRKKIVVKLPQTEQLERAEKIYFRLTNEEI
jgi:hypothetical protein